MLQQSLFREALEYTMKAIFMGKHNQMSKFFMKLSRDTSL